MLAAIVGIEIEIERLIGKFKLSQNKTPQDVAGAVDALAHSGHAELAAAMNKPLV